MSIYHRHSVCDVNPFLSWAGRGLTARLTRTGHVESRARAVGRASVCRTDARTLVNFQRRPFARAWFARFQAVFPFNGPLMVFPEKG